MAKYTKTLETVRYFSKKYPDLDLSAVEATIAFSWIARQFTDAFDAHFARHGLSRGRFGLLMSLLRQEGGTLSPAELAESCGVTRATMTGLLDTLEAAKMIERAPDQADRRGLHVRITAVGKAHLEGMLPDHYTRIDKLMAGLTRDERAQLRTLLDKIADGIPAVQAP